MAQPHTVCLVSFSTLMAAVKKKLKCLGNSGASSVHITKLKPSIHFRYLCIILMHNRTNSKPVYDQDNDVRAL